MNGLIESMTFIDIVILFVVLLDMWRGFGAGFVKSVVSLVSWFLALVIASRTAKDIAPMLNILTDNTVLQIAAAFLLVVLVVIAMTHAVALMLNSITKSLHLGSVNRILGGVLGIITGVLKVLVILSVTSPLLSYLPNWQDSILAQNLLPLAPIATELLKEVLGEAWQQIQNPYQSS
ncbi:MULTISPECIES: CvpA family protein [unclassified Moraxella]|uniref:CvpA family protein n=1 Tax=unclassified Moraxella TaxID=2685852 RepID=UPI00359D9D76